jgi:hypothetical protein
MDNGAIMLIERTTIPYAYKPFPTLRRDNIYIIEQQVSDIQR